MANHTHHHQQRPLLPRLHLFEINDQPWFPPFLRARVQAGLTHAWTAYIPGLQPASPASLVADILLCTIGPDRVARYTFIDFCSGAGGPTPSIERSLNRRLIRRALDGGGSGGGAVPADKKRREAKTRHQQQQQHDGPSYADVAKQLSTSEVSPNNNSTRTDPYATTSSTEQGAPSYAEAAKQISTDEVSPNSNGKSHDDGSAAKSSKEASTDSTRGHDAPSYAEAAKQMSTDEVSPASAAAAAAAQDNGHKKPTNKDNAKAEKKKKNNNIAEPPKSFSSDSQEDDDDNNKAVLAGVDFILTDLHPHLTSWEEAARSSARLHYVARPVNAAAAPRDLVSQATSSVTTTTHPGDSGVPVPGRDTFRLFNLAFHHFDDPAARSILRDTLATSSGFGIFELQDRSLSSFVTCAIFGVGVFLFGLPLYWWSPLTLFFIYVVPLVPLVLVFDGLVSSLRTRTPAEVEALLKSCGNKDFDAGRWEVRSGRERFLWPTGHLNWVICTKKEEGS
ncbi:uncharacterized protein B0I36DRAFT_26201 [Microdochium trichocladiopsis]|uniref:Uncharacterized protein n=1 Tax=Microdochium trichocladiopsis TaxID=1682393 RepID=A0A9P9BK51_9PEZI|nr:uncharacterized protein B0I36DRAFT_26201 [Microdochium trichocladiopsis]KAH7020864.1 hypothetical protein B0I36DRAFT_26201 [Microdochium trichocladiopsis]